MEKAVEIGLLRSINAIVNARGISKRQFGIDALSDPNLVYELENGRELRRATRQRVEAHIDGLMPSAVPGNAA